MKIESKIKISNLVTACLEFVAKNFSNKDKYPTSNHLFLAIENEILLPAIKERPQEKNLVMQAGKEFTKRLEEVLDNMKEGVNNE